MLVETQLSSSLKIQKSFPTVSKGQAFACCRNKYSKWGLDWQLWGASTLNLKKCVRKQICIYIAEAARYTVNSPGRNQTGVATRLNYSPNWIHQLFFKLFCLWTSGNFSSANLFECQQTFISRPALKLYILAPLWCSPSHVSYHAPHHALHCSTDDEWPRSSQPERVLAETTPMPRFHQLSRKIHYSN